MIQHIVIAGGGDNGFVYWGIISKLYKLQKWSYSSIKTVHGTSIGGVIAALLCMKVDIPTVTKYLVERPWDKAYKITGQHILQWYSSRGLIDLKPMAILFRPLLALNGWSESITLRELYEHTNMELFLTVTELNSYSVMTLSHLTHPDMPLITAVTATCAIPGIVQPVLWQSDCYVDGGLLCNYPLISLQQWFTRVHDEYTTNSGATTAKEEAQTEEEKQTATEEEAQTTLKDKVKTNTIAPNEAKTEEWLGIYLNSVCAAMQPIGSQSTVLDIAMSVFMQLMMRQLKASVPELPNGQVYECVMRSMTLESIWSTVCSADRRRELVSTGAGLVMNQMPK
jgi:predicted acylesterase/phospholipase RssA